jgi:hypothetical protein
MQVLRLRHSRWCFECLRQDDNFASDLFQSESGVRMEGEDGDFGGAVQAEGHAYRAEASVDVELHLVEAEEAFGIPAAHGRQHHGAQEGQADLASVRVAGEHKVDEGGARVMDCFVGEVWRVGHKNDRTVGLGGDGEVEVGMAGAGIQGSTDPEAGAVALDGDVLVDEDGNAVAVEDVDDDAGAEAYIVVAQAAVAEGAGKGAEEFGAAVDGMVAGDGGEGADGDEVSGDEDEVGSEGVDAVNDALEEVRLGELVEVDVADLDDAIAVEGAGEVADGDRTVNDVDLVAGDFAGVEGEASGGCS